MTTEIKKAVVGLDSSALLDSSMFLTGFELEFQACNGQRYSEDDDGPELDTEAAWDDLMERIGQGNYLLSIGQLTNVLPSLNLSAEVMEFLQGSSNYNVDQIRAKLDKINPASLTDETLKKVATVDIPDALEAIKILSREVSREDIEDYVTIEDIYDASDFPLESSEGGILTHTVPNIEMKTDGSVRGGEIVIDTPKPAHLCLDIARRLFAENKWDIDTGCSFHIHVSVPGINHTYGAAFQSELYLYLLSQWDRVPASVKKRWNKSLDYCRLQISTEKYTFVHYHRSLKTWEFRAFGNVSDIESATACYQLALEAIQHAYAVSLGEKKALLNPFGQSGDLFNELTRHLLNGNYSTEVLTSRLGNVALAG